MFTELFLAGYPPEDLVLKPAFQDSCRKACERLARETAGRTGDPDRPALGGGRRPLQRLCAPRRRRDRGHPIQGRPPQLRRLRREARLRTRPAAGADDDPRGPRGRPRLRGHLEGGRGRVPRRDRLRTPAGAERFALLARQDGRALQHRRRPRHRKRPADGLSQSARRPGRTGLRRRLLRPQRGLVARLPDAGLPRGCGADRLGEGRGGLALRRRSRGRGRGGARGRLRGLRARAPRLCGEEPLPRRRAGALRRHRLGALRRSCRRCARCKPGPLRDAALPLHLERVPLGRGRLRRGPGRALRHPADRPRGRRLREGSAAALRRSAAGHHRGEHAEPRARHHPDVDLEQVRADGGDDGQQVGNVGRLRHPLRRHERRLQPDQGPLQDGGLSALGSPQPVEARGRARAGRRRHPGEHPAQGTDGRIAREPEGPGFAAALRSPRRHPRMPRRARDAHLGDRREGARSRRR